MKLNLALFRALRNRNFRLFFVGQSISLIGTWMQQIAMSWLIYRLTNSAFLLGFIGFISMIPALFLSPVAGVIADRFERRPLMIIIQSLSMIQALALAVLIFTDTIAVWHIIALGIFLGFVNSFDMPVRQSFLIEIVNSRDDLGNAIALNSTMVNGARLIGPTVAGILIAATGEGVCFLINGISYIAVIASLFMMKLTPPSKEHKRMDMIKGLSEGFHYVFGFAPIRSVIILLALVSLMGMPYTVLMPILAKDILHGGPNTLGLLMGATGIGALCGAFFLASRKTVVGLGRVIPIATSIFAVGLISLGFSGNIILSMFLMLFTGFGMMVEMAASNTIIQTLADDDKRGRVMSFYAMAFRGMVPFGSLFAGSVAAKIGAPFTLAIGGFFLLIGAAWFAYQLPALRKLVRPIYIKKGIITEVLR